MIEAKDWKHVFKLDPDKPITDDALEAICESGSDAVVVGGTYGVTFDKTIDLLARVRRFEIPCVLEVSNHETIVPGFDHYFIPLVLNAKNPDWIIKPHHQAVKEFGEMIPWQDVSVVGYCVLNPDSAVAQLTKSEAELHIDDVIAYGRMALRLFAIPFFYLEYSGVYADSAFVSRVCETLHKEGDLHIFYGGGIEQKQQMEEMSRYADTVVVGNLIYEDLQAALKTVKTKTMG